MSTNQTRLARQLLGLNQTEFAAMLGWTSKRNIVNLERGDRETTIQTALAIECILRRHEKFLEFEIITEIQNRIDAQKIDIKNNYKNLTDEEIKDFVFSENDVVEQYLRENDILESDADLEGLRDMQHTMINQLEA